MKIKPVRHKMENTFKFQRFAERLKNIDVNIFHRVAHPNEIESDEIECFFYLSVQKWNILNLTEGYEAFRKEICDIVTLPQLLHKKDFVVATLIKHLNLKNGLCLQPLLEILVAFAKDLRKDFYPYYPKFLNTLIDLLNTKDTEQLEWIFHCLAYLFKFLWRYMIKDIGDIFISLLPLLSDNKPQYINNFAAESFAFVARKVKDRHSFLLHILQTLENRRDGIQGCGHLFFDTIRSVPGHFHSSAENTLIFYFESLCNKNIPQQILFEVLKSVIDNLVQNIYPKNGEIFWKCLFSTVEKCENDDDLKMLLQLGSRALNYKEGKFLINSDYAFKHYLKLINNENLSEITLLEVINFGALLLSSKNVQISQENASATVRKTLLLENKFIILEFIEKLITYSSFEALILPSFLKHFGTNLDPKSFQLLTKIILKKMPLTQSGIKLENWTKYPLELSTNTEKVADFLLLNYLDIKDLNQINETEFIYSLIILPHINSINSKKIITVLEKNITLLQNEIKLEKPPNLIIKYLFLLLLTTECVIHLNCDEKILTNIFLKENNLLENLLDLSKNSSYSVCCLKIIDLIATSFKNTSYISYENLKNIHEKLQKGFSSPYHQIRLLTSHIYSLFEEIPELNSENPENETWNVFSICFQVENIQPLVDTYRDQIQLLQKLTYDMPQSIICKNTIFSTIPLQYFLGCLYMNFQLIWEPIRNLIETYAHGMPIQTFWDVFSYELKECVENIKNVNTFEKLENFDGDEILSEIYGQATNVDNKPDFFNYRILLWQSMSLFADVAEVRSRDVSSLLLGFIENEYRSSNSNEAFTWNIKQNSDKSEELENEETEESKDEEIKDDLKTATIKTGKLYLKTLLTTLRVFTKIRNPKSMYREPELYKLYLDLLNNRNSEIQKTALDCLMVYKFKYLTPYKTNIYSLIDDKSFKNELSLFRIDKETAVVQEDHRKDLIPIVLRIVHSKMMAKTGLRTGGKSSGQLRRNLVVRFLAGCHENEKLEFIHMSFKFYSKYLRDDLQEMIDNIIHNIDLEHFIPPKRLQSALNFLKIVLEHFGGLMGNNLLNYLLKILIIIGSSITGALTKKSEIHSGYLTSLRNLRTSCQGILARFFSHFESYPWSCEEIEAIFQIFIWPFLNTFATEGIHSPTALLKLFHQWSLNPRYFNLLINHKTGDLNCYVLPEIIKLFLAPKVHITVTNTILEMLEKLLLLKIDEEIEKDVPPIIIKNEVPLSENIMERLKIEEINFGSCILLPFVPNILERLKRKLNTKSKGLNSKELFIMSRISELVWEPATCDTVLTLILPMINKKSQGSVADETILQMVTTIYNLIKTVNNPQKHLRKIAPLFCEVTSIPTRKLLIEILKITSNEFEVVDDLNSFNKKWVDQPDFEKRQNAFKQINQLIESDAISFELGVIIIYNCFYLIRNESDLALREGSKMCLRTLVPYLLSKFKEKDFLLNEIVFPIIKKGFKSKNENYKYESISLLGHLARKCSESSVILKDLSLFANEQDLEVDVFENLLHLQLYRQTRALNKFNSICAELKAPLNPRTLTQFILPLVSSYLLNEQFSSKNSLIDSSIEAMKTICNLLPWQQYENILKFYLGRLRFKLEFQRQLVRLTVAILDAYHFDLSKAHSDNKQIDEIKEEIDEKVEEINEKKEETKNENVETKEEAENEEQTEIDDILENLPEDFQEEPLQESLLDTPLLLRQTVLSPSAAKRVIFSIKTILLPQLHKAIGEMTLHESSHKLNRKRSGVEREEEELQKVPISLAVVKLLQKLPVEILEKNLSGIFLKTCTFLKSPLDSVRRVARDTLQKIMATLGPKYLGLLITEMSTLLLRGFQVHVLVYTIHSVLVSLKESFQPTDIDKCLITILDVCKLDLFGSLAEEREVAKIANKISEAKSTKSFDTFQILAQYITEKCLLDLLLPLKDVLLQSNSYKIVSKVQECLRRIVLGLVDNTFIPVESLLMFAYGTASESIPQFIAANTNKKQLTQQEIDQKAKEKPDCFIIPKPPVYRSGYRINNVRNSLKTNAHLLVEFGLRLCYFVLKRDKIKMEDYLKFIDPFVVIFKNCLNSRHVKMCTLTIQCLSWIMKYDLPAMKENIKEIVATIFELLHKYAAAGLSKGDNFDLVVASFKAMSILVRDIKYYQVTTDQLKALLLYAEQDLHDCERQATAFALLKSIINRKLIIPEIHEIMKKVAELSITSDMSHIRLQCRQIFHQFLMDYPLGKELDNHLAFFLNQLNYELQSGRESALEMIFGIINSFPLKVLKKQSGTFFVILGASLINDNSPECRKMVAKCLQNLLERLDKNGRNVLFEMVTNWFNDKAIMHRRLAAQLCGIIITVEKENFSSRLPILIPLIKYQLDPNLADKTPGKFVRLKSKAVIQLTENSEKIKPRDHQLFQLLQMLLKLCANCPIFLEKTKDIEIISQYVQNLLSYPHEWVRIGAVQFIGYVLSKLKIDHLSNLLINKKCEEHGYLYSDPENTIKSLTLDLCAQLIPGTIKEEMGEQIIKNLVFIARVIEKVPISSKDIKDTTEEDEVVNDHKINLLWLAKRLRKIINKEIVETPKSTVLRTEIFKWIAAVTTTIDKEVITKILNNLLSPLVREMTTTDATDSAIRQLATKVANLLKKKVGNDLYISTLSKLQLHLNAKRTERKRERLQLAVTNPDLAAQKKIKLQEKKKINKKRKMEMVKGKKYGKKRRKDVNLDDSEPI